MKLKEYIKKHIKTKNEINFSYNLENNNELDIIFKNFEDKLNVNTIIKNYYVENSICDEKDIFNNIIKKINYSILSSKDVIKCECDKYNLIKNVYVYDNKIVYCEKCIDLEKVYNFYKNNQYFSFPEFYLSNSIIQKFKDYLENEGYEKLDFEFSYDIGDDNTDLPYKVLEYYNKEGVDIIFFQNYIPDYYGTNKYYIYLKRRIDK